MLVGAVCVAVVCWTGDPRGRWFDVHLRLLEETWSKFLTLELTRATEG